MSYFDVWHRRESIQTTKIWQAGQKFVLCPFAFWQSRKEKEKEKTDKICKYILIKIEIKDNFLYLNTSQPVRPGYSGWGPLSLTWDLGCVVQQHRNWCSIQSLPGLPGHSLSLQLPGQKTCLPHGSSISAKHLPLAIRGCTAADGGDHGEPGENRAICPSIIKCLGSYLNHRAQFEGLKLKKK